MVFSVFFCSLNQIYANILTRAAEPGPRLWLLPRAAEPGPRLRLNRTYLSINSLCFLSCKTGIQYEITNNSPISDMALN